MPWSCTYPPYSGQTRRSVSITRDRFDPIELRSRAQHLAGFAEILFDKFHFERDYKGINSAQRPRLQSILTSGCTIIQIPTTDTSLSIIFHLSRTRALNHDVSRSLGIRIHLSVSLLFLFSHSTSSFQQLSTTKILAKLASRRQPQDRGMCTQVIHQYSCGHTVRERARCPGFSHGRCVRNTTRTVLHGPSCPSCQRYQARNRNLICPRL